MPYIGQGAREELDKFIDRIPASTLSPGELNYLITRILLKTSPKKYADYNTLIGTLESVKLELYRRVVSLYEDEKMKEHGDVY